MDLLGLISETGADAGAASRAFRLFWATLGLLGVVFFGLVLMMTIRRAVRRRSQSSQPRGDRAVAGSAWSESARRLSVSPIDGDADPDHDTVDFDPEGDGPRRS